MVMMVLGKYMVAMAVVRVGVHNGKKAART